MRETDRKKNAEAGAWPKLKQKEEEAEVERKKKQKLAQGAKAALSAAKAEGALLQTAQNCFLEVDRQFHNEVIQGVAGCRAGLCGRIRLFACRSAGLLGSLVLNGKSLKKMNTQLKAAEKARAKSDADKIRRLMRMRSNGRQTDK